MPKSPDRTVGVTPEIQQLLDEVYKGADASAAKDYLNKYIWVKLWQHVNKIVKVEPTHQNLMEQREAIRGCLTMAQDLKLEMSSARNASEKLKSIYDKSF